MFLVYHVYFYCLQRPEIFIVLFRSAVRSSCEPQILLLGIKAVFSGRVPGVLNDWTISPAWKWVLSNPSQISFLYYSFLPFLLLSPLGFLSLSFKLQTKLKRTDVKDVYNSRTFSVVSKCTYSWLKITVFIIAKWKVMYSTGVPLWNITHSNSFICLCYTEQFCL